MQGRAQGGSSWKQGAVQGRGRRKIADERRQGKAHDRSRGRVERKEEARCEAGAGAARR